MKSKLSIAPLAPSVIGIISTMLLTGLTPLSLNAQQETDYGTSRRPQTCSSRSEPRNGPISAAQAIKYATCDAEGDQVVPSPGIASFLEIFSLQVGSARRVSPEDIVRYGETINQSKPIYEIKGRAVLYACSRIKGFAVIAKRGSNCQTWGSTDSASINSRGKCFTDFANKWRCKLSIGTAISVSGPPPAR
jgi:hypothetical protein